MTTTRALPQFCPTATVLLVLLAASPALADSDKSQPVNVMAEYGLPVHRSGTLDSMDFGNGYRVGIQTYAGKSKDFGLAIEHDVSTTDYTQVDGSFDATWTDFVLGYRILYFYPKVSIGHCAIAADLDGVDLVDGLGTSAGGGLEVRVATGAMAVAFADLTYTTVDEARDAAGQEIKIGPRTDFDMGVAIRLPWANVDVTPGYRYRTYTVSISGDSETELETGPYLGFSMGFSP